ncbi:MAG TPA: tetratricopeptide repeat protein [Verrucomicrobiae bacterium]|nr:tetratricopeptide repeat protein [Verrucomicrobiae bacterium]
MKARKFIPLLLIAAGLIAYLNSFRDAFVLDDLEAILDNPTIRHLWPIWRCLSPPHRGGLTVEGRPLINLSLAVNYAVGGYNVWGYHAFNLTVHILAGLTLLGIVRRMLLTPPLVLKFGAAADELALAAAVLWTVHPLNTESVTYIIQRAESLMGLFYLLTLYCFIRGVESAPLQNLVGTRCSASEGWPRSSAALPSAPWSALSVVACALGMVSKEVMVSAPLMVLLYDRAFVSASFREAWRRRWPLYVALASTWILLGVVVVSAGPVATTAMNARRLGLRWWEYLATEPGVILYYLRLSVWPSPLCLNHPWPIANTWLRILPPAVVVSILVGASAWAWRKNPAPTSKSRQAWGFVGAWFFLILAPSSSFIPLHDALYEHRMYLSSAVVVSLVVLGLYSAVGRRSLAVFVAVAIGLGFLTWRRNQDYRSEVALWSDTVAKFPNYAGPHYSLATALQRAGRNQEAIGQYEQALRFDSSLADAHNNLGNILEHMGKLTDAIEQYEQVLRINPDYVQAHNNLGNVLLEAGRVREAIEQLQQALRIKPDFAEAHYNLGVALWQAGRVQEAIGHWEEAVRFKPDYLEAHYNLGIALKQVGRIPEAIEHFQQALRIKPDFAEAKDNLARLRTAQ